jgi:hypothetical protein
VPRSRTETRFTRERAIRPAVKGAHRPDPFGGVEEPLAPMRGCLFGLLLAAALWALGGLLAFVLFELDALAIAGLGLAVVISAGLAVAGAVHVARRLRGEDARRRQRS